MSAFETFIESHGQLFGLEDGFDTSETEIETMAAL